MNFVVLYCCCTLPKYSHLNQCFRRIRTTRATSNQIEALLAALEAQPFLATRRFTGLQGRENFEISWKKVAAELNNIIYGSVKTPNQWLTVWRDLKSRACMKAAKIRKEKVQTGNRPIKTPPLTEIEKRIISLIGADYSIGTNCPDSMPEEDVIQCSLEAGVNVNTNDGWMVDVPQSNNEIDVDNTEVLTEPPETAQIVARGSAQVTNAPSFEHQVRPRRNINLNPRRSVAEQHNSARSDFLAIAQSNAESMRMLAAAATQQAEAAKIQAEATLLFGQALNKIVDALLVDKNKNA